jgi:hypothetical protein
MLHPSHACSVRNAPRAQEKAMQASEFITRREKIIKAFQRGIIDRVNAVLALCELFTQAGFTDGNIAKAHEILDAA